MKDYTLGIVGGMGSYATADFFLRMLNAFPAEKEWERPRIVIDNYCTMPSRVRAILYNEKREELIEKLSESVKNLINIGANRIVLACNTSHVFVPDVIRNVPESQDCIINLIEECTNRFYEEGIKQVGLIATEGTIDTQIYPSYFGKYAINISTPDESQFQALRMFIEVIKQNKIDDMVLECFLKFLDSFEEDVIVLGCTEFPVLYRYCVERGYTTKKKIVDPLQYVIDIVVKEYSNIEG